ncbi:lytic transglycosylase domain-containing protein [Candidatus Methylobacter oryzae]|uniref:lytic transglycosylase domain-containing protein n=1 Tax=Candidatus Methylobacter oryzae TaxID=2497749 RepID=UPI001F4F7E36|nr:lytic transglycosylase domain-containing protein [Candidatus Methylobacter oryzae]
MKCLAWIVLLCPLLFSDAVSGNTLDQQRNDFLQAEKLLAQGNVDAFMRASAALLNYPLYPYLQYQWLKDNLHQADQIQSFLAVYKDTRYAGLLRSKWLDYLAKNEQWPDFIRNYIARDGVYAASQSGTGAAIARDGVYAAGQSGTGAATARDGVYAASQQGTVVAIANDSGPASVSAGTSPAIVNDVVPAPVSLPAIVVSKVTENTALECEYNLARYKTGNEQQALSEAERLWLTGDSLPQECDPLLSVLMMSPRFTPELIWQRFELALRKDNVSVAEYVRRSMSRTDQDAADVWLRIHQKPELIENNVLSPGMVCMPQACPEQAGRLTPQMGKLFAHGIERLAKSDLNLAIRIWDDRKVTFQIDEQTARHLERNLAISLARSRNPGAYFRLSQLPADAEVNEWKMRAALLEQNWQHVGEALAGLTVQERLDPKWQYWQARLLDKTGNSIQAKDAYLKLAEDRSFYGFLAADYVNKPYQFANKPIFLTASELSNLADETDFKMVSEFKALNRDMEAERQWWYAVKKLSKERMMIAAKLAQQWHWDQVAIATLVKADYWDDLALRFPVYYANEVHTNASLHNLDPAIVFGLIRQESIFNKNAESAVGARGLMQVMPKTGMQIARDLKEKWRSDSVLFNPGVNVRYGAFYYKQLLKQFHGHFALAIAAYNAGAGRVSKWLPSVEPVPADIWIETIPFKETRKYVTSVLSYSIIYQQLMQRNALKIKELMLDVLPG